MIKTYYCPDCERETSFESVNEYNTEEFDSEYECIICGSLYEKQDLENKSTEDNK